MGKAKKQPFKVEMSAENQNMAVEKLYCELGARHRCPRRFIKIEKIEEVKQ